MFVVVIVIRFLFDIVPPAFASSHTQPRPNEHAQSERRRPTRRKSAPTLRLPRSAIGVQPVVNVDALSVLCWCFGTTLRRVDVLPFAIICLVVEQRNRRQRLRRQRRRRLRAPSRRILVRYMSNSDFVFVC